MKAICNSRTERDRWIAERMNGIGASEVPALIGLSHWQTPLSLYAQKIGATPVEDEQPEYVEWGNRLEGVILEVYGERTGRKVKASGVLYHHDEFPWARATFDAFTVRPPSQEPIPLNAKTTSAFRAEDWAEGVPPLYAAQLHWEMFVAQANASSSTCLIGGQRMVWDDVERDPVLINRLFKAAEEFWRCVTTRTPPPADGTELSREALKILYPKDSGEVALLPATLIEAADALEITKVESKKVEEVRLLAENQIKAAMGNASRGVLPDGRQFSWTTQQRKGYVVQPSESRVFRALKSKEGE